MICNSLIDFPTYIFFTFVWSCIVTNFFVITPNRRTNFTNTFVMKLYMFRTVRLSIIRSLFSVHSAMVYVIQVCRQLSSRTRMELVPSWSIPYITISRYHRRGEIFCFYLQSLNVEAVSAWHCLRKAASCRSCWNCFVTWLYTFVFITCIKY